MNASGILPKDLKILVRPDAIEKKTAGGIILPDSASDKQKWNVMRGTLIAVGENAFREWGEGVGPKPGARVVYAQFSGATIKGVDDGEYVIMNDADVVAELEAAHV